MQPLRKVAGRKWRRHLLACGFGDWGASVHSNRSPFDLSSPHRR